MLVNYLMISSKWNFLAEGSLHSLPVGIHPYIIHVNKSHERIMQFKSNNVQKQWFVHAPPKKPRWATKMDTSHGSVLDILFESDEFNQIIECDILVFLDHDCYFQESFSEMNQIMIEAISLGKLISGGKSTYQYFRTFPAFAVKPIKGWPSSWVPQCYTRNFDTGQYIASLLPRELVYAFPCQEPQYHWGSWYCCQDSVKKKYPDIYKSRRRRYVDILCSGKWTPPEEELNEMHEYHILQPAVKAYKEQRQAMGAICA